MFVSLATLGCLAHARLAPACDVLLEDQRPAKPSAPAAASLRTHREWNVAGRGGGGRTFVTALSPEMECTLLAATPSLAQGRVASLGQATLVNLGCSWRIQDVSPGWPGTHENRELHLRAISADSKSMLHLLQKTKPNQTKTSNT